MRNIIDKDIILKEPRHKYILKTDPSIDFQSVTEVIGNYFKPFDKQAIAEKLVARNIKYADTTVEALIAQWDAARDYGTKVHNEIELYINQSIIPDETRASNAIEWLEKYCIPYDELLFGKPHVDVFIDDKGMKFKNWDDVKKQLLEKTDENKAKVDEIEALTT